MIKKLTKSSKEVLETVAANVVTFLVVVALVFAKNSNNSKVYYLNKFPGKYIYYKKMTFYHKIHNITKYTFA